MYPSGSCSSHSADFGASMKSEKVCLCCPCLQEISIEQLLSLFGLTKHLFANPGTAPRLTASCHGRQARARRMFILGVSTVINSSCCWHIIPKPFPLALRSRTSYVHHRSSFGSLLCCSISSFPLALPALARPIFRRVVCRWGTDLTTLPCTRRGPGLGAPRQHPL